MTIYYIDPVEGDDANAGTSEGAGNAWKTIEKAISLPPVHGDVIYCKNNGTYTPSGSSWVMPLNSGGYLYGVSWIGYETTPGDDGRCTVDCLGTKNAFTTNLSTQQYHILRNWDIWNSSGTAVGAATNGSGWQIMNVRIFNPGGTGIQASSLYSIWNCEIYGDGTNPATTGGMYHVYNSVFEGSQAGMNSPFGMVRCVLRSLGTGPAYVGTTMPSAMLMNTFVGPGNGTESTISGPTTFTNFHNWLHNILSNGTYGMDWKTATSFLTWEVDNFFGDDNGASHSKDLLGGFASNLASGSGSTLFNDPDNGDYTLQSASDCRGTAAVIGMLS